MDQKIPEVHQYPIAFVIAFNTYRRVADGLQRFLDFIADRLTLARIRNRANDEIIGKRGDVAKIQHFDLKGFS